MTADPPAEPRPALRRPAMLSAFQVRSYRFQWPADLLASWAFEMETLVLGWYILVETGSVKLLAVLAALAYLGTLIAPLFGVIGDRFGHKNVYCAVRGAYAVLSTAMMAFGLTGTLTPTVVFVIVTLMGIIRPSDISLRNVLIGNTIPPANFGNALGLSRATQDSARIIGALVGAGLFTALGIGYTYLVIAVFYAASMGFTFGISRQIDPGDGPMAAPTAPVSPWRDFKDGIAYVWRTPGVLAIMWLAFFINFTAVPLTSNMMPYVARELFQLDAAGLGRLVACYAGGALTGSLVMSWIGPRRRPGRFCVQSAIAWYAVLLLFGQADGPALGGPLLFVVGMGHSIFMISLAVTLLSGLDPRFRGRAMGVRTLAVYGLPLGLTLAGWLIEAYGYHATLVLYCASGVAVTVLTTLKFRQSLWR